MRLVFGRRKRAQGQAEPATDAPAREPEPDPEDGADREHALLLQCWRRSEQRVLRSWHAWQAAATDDKPERYREYLRALADEERAAASIELATGLRAAQNAGNGGAQPARH